MALRILALKANQHRVLATAALPLSVAVAWGCERAPFTDGLPETMDCSSCHGSPGDPAPPVGIHGATSTSEIGVGAHQAHLLGNRIAAPVACSECHVIPTNLLTHPDPLGGPAKVVFGPKAQLLGAQPAWDRATASCAGGYCHGATLPEAETRLPVIWTVVDGSQASCTSCHGNPPGGAHPADAACESCHGAVMAPGGVIKNPELHVDGKTDLGDVGLAHPEGYAAPELHGPDTNSGLFDCRQCHGQQLEGSGSVVGCDPCHQQGWRTNCIYCHGGTVEPSGAPPHDLFGNDDTSIIGVGAHTAHVTLGSHPAYACAECHAPVTDVMTPGHLFDASPGRSEVVFTEGISVDGLYSGGGCSNLYCHGTGITGITGGTIASFVPGEPLNCQSCHPAATQSASHADHAMFSCEDCHMDVVSDATTIIAPELHVNGSVSVTMSAGTWNEGPRTCTDTACHGAEAIPW